MAKRKTTTFGWVRGEDDVEGNPTEAPRDDDWTDRDPPAVHRANMRDLKELVVGLSRLPPSVRRELPVPPEALDELERFVALGPTPARRRQLMRAKNFFRDLDPEPLVAILAGRSPRDAELQQVERWRARLVGGTDADLDAFLLAHPQGDRRQLRAVVREARGDGPAASRAAKRLFRLLGEALRGVPEEDEGDEKNDDGVVEDEG